MNTVASQGNLFQEGVAERWARLCGSVDSYELFLEARRVAASAGFGGTDALNHLLGQSLMEKVRAIHAVNRRNASVGQVYVLPKWIVCDPVYRSEGASGGLRVTLPGDSDGAGITVLDMQAGSAPSKADLRIVTLRGKRRSRKRRQWIAFMGKILLDDLRFFHETELPDKRWLERMVEDPGAVEDEALKIWSEFVADCRIPESFCVPERDLTLADLLLLRCGGESERHRLSFAEQQPWATRMVLSLPQSDAAFSQIDENPAYSIVVAARMLCCTGAGATDYCEKAVRFARYMARHRANAAIDGLLGLDRTIKGLLTRSLLMAAHEQDGGELFSHIGGNFERARRQIDQAFLVLIEYQHRMSGSFDCAHAVAALLIRLMVRNKLSPDDLDPESMVSGLAAVSADCLAAFAARSLRDPTVPSPPDDGDSLDVGILALTKFLGRTRRPGITAGQLVKFTRAAQTRGIHQVQILKRHTDATWPLPAGLSRLNDDEIDGAHVRFLDSVQGILAEGKRMKNCLAGSRYVRAALLGQLVFFSIRTPGGKSTLALRPIVEQCSDGEYTISEWGIVELRGVENCGPDNESVQVASALVERMNSTCPQAIPGAEIRRRARILSAMNESRSFNPDAALAWRRWRAIYLKLLPRRFASIHPGGIVDAYLRAFPRSPEAGLF